MDEFSLQETHRFQNQEMVEQIGAWVFQGTDDAPGRAGRLCYSLRQQIKRKVRKWKEKVQPVCIHSGLGSIVLCVTAQQLHHYFGCSFTERDERKVKWAKHTIPDLKCLRAGASSTGTSSCSRPALHTPGEAECVSSLYSDSSLWSTSAPAYDTEHQSSFTISLFIARNKHINAVELREISS